MNFDWYPDWSGQTCIIVASGPSAASVPLERARGKARFIAVNNSWRLAPWADVLYGCDHEWWDDHNGVPEFAGLKVSQDPKAVKRYRDIRLVICERAYDRKDKLILDRKGYLGWGGNGGFHAANFVAQCNPKKIVLVGYDMRVDHGVHWHKPHPPHPGKKLVRNPQRGPVKRWVQSFDGVAPTFKDAGIEVINVSEVSALNAYPKMSFAEALA